MCLNLLAAGKFQYKSNSYRMKNLYIKSLDIWGRIPDLTAGRYIDQPRRQRKVQCKKFCHEGLRGYFCVISISRSNFISSISRVLRRFSYVVWCAEYVKNIKKYRKHSCSVERLFRGQISFLPQTQQATAASPEMSRNILTFALSMTQYPWRGPSVKVIPLGCLISVSPLASHVGVLYFYESPCISRRNDWLYGNVSFVCYSSKHGAAHREVSQLGHMYMYSEEKGQ